MKIRLALLSLLFLAIITVGCSTNPTPSTPSASPAISAAAADPLPSWNDGPAKQAILDFVKTTTDKSNPKFVAPEDRIATFDQDGTTGSSSPSTRRCCLLSTGWAILRPSIRSGRPKTPFKAILTGDKEAMAKFTLKDIEVIAWRPTPA